jgi:hypothetical protein
MNLFNKELTVSEAMHYNSILDNVTVDTDLLVLQSSLNTPSWTPGSADPFVQYMNQARPQTTSSKPTTSNPTTSKNIGKPVQKNVKRQYIRLPNAIIRKHKHKYRVSKTQRVNETQDRGESRGNQDLVITDED